MKVEDFYLYELCLLKEDDYYQNDLKLMQKILELKITDVYYL